MTRPSGPASTWTVGLSAALSAMGILLQWTSSGRRGPVELDDAAVDRCRDGSQVRQRYIGRRDMREPWKCWVVRDRLGEHRGTHAVDADAARELERSGAHEPFDRLIDRPHD